MFLDVWARLSPYKRVTLGMGEEAIIFKLSDGNPGVMVVMSQLVNAPLKKAHFPEPIFYLNALDVMEIYGEDIWVIYKDDCKCDLEVMRETIAKRYSAYLDLALSELKVK